MAALVLQLSTTFTDSTLPSLQRDDVIVNGTSICLDLDLDYCWPGGDPVDTSEVKDLTLNARHASVGLASGSISFTGNGFDFTSAPDSGKGGIQIPASAIAPFWGGNQYFLVCTYIKLPLLADWEPTINTKTFFDTGGNQSININGLSAIGQRSTGLVAHRKLTSGFSILTIPLANLTNFHGTVCQIAHYRDANFEVIRIKNSLGTQTASQSAGSPDPNDFSALYGWFGVPEAVNLHPTGNRKKFRAYRMFMENLETSGRNPVTVLNDDWTRTSARGVFS